MSNGRLKSLLLRLNARLSRPVTIHNRFIDINVTIPDLQIKAALRVGAHPGLIDDRSALASKIRKGNQISIIALATLGKDKLLHFNLLPSVYFLEYTLASLALTSTQAKIGQLTIYGTIWCKLTTHQCNAISRKRAKKLVPHTLQFISELSSRG